MQLQRAMHDTVTEVGRVVQAEGIACDFQQGGYLNGWAVDPTTGQPNRAALAPIQIDQSVSQAVMAKTDAPETPAPMAQPPARIAPKPMKQPPMM